MTDTLTTRLVVIMLGSIALVTVVGGIILALNDRTLPDSLVAIGSGATGAVAALLAQARGTSSGGAA
jgi:hypothetical protein